MSRDDAAIAAAQLRVPAASFKGGMSSTSLAPDIGIPDVIDAGTADLDSPPDAWFVG